ncbi:MAG TPA: UDP-N-acetylmuramoyl-tripeptide--D-alanyl-D-alanine ligase [Longimicrobiales bacterium]|nr:UDP-N-acetylmuramoyl-tripeptide--D-alanyl-D-alanine ligase [Longimicrobiales bacterium]
MTRWTEDEVLAALRLAVPSGSDAAGGRAGSYSSVGTDTRTIEPGALFVALRGENFDGHTFLSQAAEKGAAGAVVDSVPDGAPPLRYYTVPDTLGALGRMASHRRREVGARVAAITGTNGKTTTKEMARAILSTRYRTHATSGNLNNLIGAPLTLLDIPEDAEVIVVEIGTNAPGEIARLSAVVEPDVGIVTAVAEGHLEGFGTVEGVLREKTTLLSRLRPGGVAIVADEPASLPERARSLARRVRVGGWSDRADADLRAESLRLDEAGRVVFTWNGREVTLPFGGKAHARNALLALALGQEWGVEVDGAVAALEKLPAPSMRGEVHRFGELVVIADCYNANPASLAAAVDTLTAMPRRGGRVAVVGSMLELGPTSRTLHEESARRLAASELDLVVGTGMFVEAFRPLVSGMGDRLVLAEDADAAWEPLSERLDGGEVVLLKGSRGVALERLMPRLRERFGEASHDRSGS